MDAPNRSHVGLAFEHGFRLEALTIEPATGEVTGPAGREKLDPKVMGVLVQLAVRAGQVVSREDLHEQLWPNAVVTDDALTRCIHELRRHLERAGGGERYRAMIETLPKRGYRLNGVVAPHDLPEVAPQPPKARRAWIAAAAVAAGAALILFAMLRRDADPVAPPAAVANSVAVLPFADMSEAQDQEYFGDGMAEEILNRLAKSGGLRVISRTSSFSFRGADLDIPSIAAKLDVSHVLEGSVRRAGDNVRITAQLISAADNSHVWSETYDRGVGGLLDVQDEIAEAVATALRVKLTAASEAGTPANPEAYELFLQGRFFYNRRAPGDIERAARYFRDSLAHDPSFARAWAALAGAYALLLHDAAGDEERLRPLQRDAASKAVEFGPDLAVAHARLSQYYFQVGEPGKGEQHFARAKALDPDDPLVMGFSGDDAILTGDFEGAVEVWRRLVERDPLSPTDRINYANFLLLAGNAEQATAQFRKALELNPEFDWDARLGLLRSLVVQRRYDEAEAEIPRLPDGLPRDSGLAFLHDAPARHAEADAALERLVRAGEEVDQVMLAEIFAFRGMTNDAFTALSAAKRATQGAAHPAHTMRSKMYWLRMEMLKSPFLLPLHSDPRWRALVAEPP